MTRLRVLLARMAAMFAGRRRDDQLSDEIATHLDLLAAEYRRRGLADADARAAARREFGGVEQVRQTYREQRRLPSIDALFQDVRYGARLLARDRGSTLAAIGILTLGVGSTVVMADMLDRLLLRPPSHIDAPDRVRRVYDHVEGGTPQAMITNYVTFERLTAGLTKELSHAAVYLEERIGYGQGPGASRFRVISHSAEYFDALGLKPALGVLPGRGRAPAAETAVISHALWQQRFGGTDDVLGRTMRLGTRVYTIIGVTPPGFTGIDTEPVDVWLPIEARGEKALFREWRTSDAYFMFRVVARLRPGVDRVQAEAHASTVFNAGLSPAWFDGKTRSYRIYFGDLAAARQPGRTDEVRVVLWIAAVSGFVLLIACGNVGNLLYVRGLRRGRELALKTALGATRLRLLREILTEAGLLALLSSAVSLMFVLTAGTLVRRFFLPSAITAVVPIDGRLVALTLAICVTATFLLGLLPALRLTTRASLAPGRAAMQERPSRLLDLYIALQVALSVPLVVGASLFALSFWQARHVNFGIHTSNIAVVTTDMVEAGAGADSHAAHRRIEAQLRRLPQVKSVAAVMLVPMVGGMVYHFDIPGVNLAGKHMGPFVNGVDASYFDVMGVRMIAGRAFTGAENVAGGRPVLVINETMARTYWPHESPLGRCIRVGDPDKPCAEIIGIAANNPMWPALDALPRDAPMLYFVPIEQYSAISWSRALLVRTREAPGRVLGQLRSQAQAAGADLPYIDVWAFDDVFNPALRPLRLGSTVFVVFAALALLIAGVGLAAVTAHGVTRRTRELGIRLALGADPTRLVRLVLGRSLGAVLGGLVCGALLSYFGERLIRSFLFGVKEGDPRLFATGVLTLLVVSALAAYLPARRAGHVDAAEALRTD